MRRSNLLGLWCLLAGGCAGPRALPPPAGATLPFRAFLRVEVRDSRELEGAGRDGVMTYFHESKQELLEALARNLKDAKVFHEVSTDPAAGQSADIELEVVVDGSHFGQGEVNPGAAFFSTIAWLFTGHLSWLIEDRRYAAGDVRVEVSLPRIGKPSREFKPLLVHTLELEGLELSFLERADVGQAFLNILLPPWVGAGDPERAGRSLTRRAVEAIVSQEPLHIHTQLPSTFWNETQTYLLLDAPRQVIIASPRRLESVKVIDSRGKVYSMDVDVANAESTDEKRNDLYRRDLERVLQTPGELTERVFFYSFVLDDARWQALGLAAEGTLQVLAAFRQSEVGPWTIRLPPLSRAVTALP